MSADGFLSRWSRRKAAVQGGADPVYEQPVASGPAPPVTTTAAATELPAAPPPAAVPATPPPPALTMDDVARLTPESDYARFVARSVDPGVRNAAMKKLFTDPHYNIMDGLDIYIDDYGIADPIPESMLRQMVQSKALGLFDHEKTESVTDATPALAIPADAPPPPPEPAPDEDTDLQLQPDDDAGRASPEAGAGEDAGQPH